MRDWNVWRERKKERDKKSECVWERPGCWMYRGPRKLIHIYIYTYIYICIYIYTYMYMRERERGRKGERERHNESECLWANVLWEEPLSSLIVPSLISWNMCHTCLKHVPHMKPLSFIIVLSLISWNLWSDMCHTWSISRLSLFPLS